MFAAFPHFLEKLHSQTQLKSQGYARLRRMDIVVETLPTVTQKRWKRFIAAVAFDQRVEFGAGDLGVAGGVAMTEPGNANPTTIDQINRYGGS